MNGDRRGIKFRCWHKSYKVYSSLLTLEEIRLLEDQMIVDEKDFCWEQFTGVEDKNGREIYEGDIVRHKVGKIVVTGPVSWSQDGALWIKGSSQALSAYKKSTEIIGNIHESPELLEGEK